MSCNFIRTTGKDEWLTPPDLLKRLGEFDLDPCAPSIRPWEIAKAHYTLADDGLAKPWTGRVFCNPPYGAKTQKWLARCAEHGNAIALIFARTDTQMFFDYVWAKSNGVLFIRGRLHFYTIEGAKYPTNSGAASCLVAYGESNGSFLASLAPALGAWCGKKEAACVKN